VPRRESALGGKVFNPTVGEVSLRSGEKPTAQIKQGVRKVVFRKLMAGAVLCSVPVLSFGVAQVATTGNAGAVTPTICAGSAAGSAVTFTAPGLSYTGNAQVSANSSTKTGASNIKCVTGAKSKNGSLLASKIKSTSTDPCPGTAPAPTPCPAGQYVVNSVAQLLNAQGSLYQSDKTTSWMIGTTKYTTSNTSDPTVTYCDPGAGPCTAGTPGQCIKGTVGFALAGALTAPAKMAGTATEITACLDQDSNGKSGMGTTGSFAADVATIAGGSSAIVIGAATLDPANSTIEF
jgi:hypothetical protein